MYLEKWVDAQLALPNGTTAGTLATEEVERLVRNYTVAQIAGSIPRRLGAATGGELSADKKTSRRIAHVMRQCLVSWDHLPDEDAPQDVALRRSAAQIVWSEWLADQQSTLLARMRRWSTWAVLHGGDQAAAKSALVRLNNEASWLAHACREA